MPHLPYKTCHLHVRVGGEVKPFPGTDGNLLKNYLLPSMAGQSQGNFAGAS